jgi:hypothetical protein
MRSGLIYTNFITVDWIFHTRKSVMILGKGIFLCMEIHHSDHKRVLMALEHIDTKSTCFSGIEERGKVFVLYQPRLSDGILTKPFCCQSID